MATRDDRQERILELVEALIGLDKRQQERVLRKECGDDEDLRDEVRRLVALDGRVDGFLARLADTGTDPPAVDEQSPDTSSVLTEGGSAFGEVDRTGTTADHVAPESIGPYRVIRTLGEGGMGVVHLVEQQHPVRRRVALKVIRPGMATAEIVTRFEAERQALAMLEHPAIARVYDAGTTEEGRPYFVMEYVKGLPIKDYCDRHRLDASERLRLIVEVCRGFEHAHRKGIIHRDIKPSNVLVHCPDKTPVVKIIDFGIAKATKQSLTEKTLHTEVGRAVGTPAYMSPEQTELNSENLDRRTDVYSLGILIYELLVGELPLDWDSVSRVAFDEILRRIREEEPPTPSVRWLRLSRERQGRLARARQTDAVAFGRELRGDIDWITMKAIEKERRRRYATAEELGDDVERYLRGDPVLAGPPTFTYQFRKYARKNRGPLTAIGAVLGVLILGLIGTLLFASVAQRRLTRITRLSDQKRIELYTNEARSLWPQRPERIADLKAWLQNVDPLADRLEEHREALGSLGSLDSFEAQWEHDILTTLVDDLSVFLDPGQRHGDTVGSVRRRLEFASTITRRSLDDHAQDWKDAVRSIADRKASPRYGGLDIRPQLGLVPLGKDPRSGLWEFADLQTGTPPRRTEDGSFAITAETGLVFVLIPGGRFQMGAGLGVAGESKEDGFHVREIAADSLAATLGLERADRIVSVNTRVLGMDYSFDQAQRGIAPGDTLSLEVVRGDSERILKATCDTHLDPDAELDELPIHDVGVEPFFLAKYEMTQGQWERFTGENPSYYFPGNQTGSDPITLLNPLENVSWQRCQMVLAQMGFRLPSEAEWEFAARAGTRTIWWSGNTVETLKDGANLGDATLARANPAFAAQCELSLDDGHVNHAAVGSYRANGYGLHDVAGNVWEWCEDTYRDTYAPPAPGAESNPVNESIKISRGGGWGFNAVFCRSADRAAFLASQARQDVGLRPARRVE